MKCPRCEQENPSHAKFCLECGAQLAHACGECGAGLPPGAKFCLQCGKPAGSQSTPPSRAALEAYTPKHLARKILTSKSALEGERKQVTVLFCDIVDSSRLAEQLGPEGMHQVMDLALRLMADAVHRYEGTVNQFLGDGLMALFGAPVALEDHAFRGVQAALAIQETLRGYSEQLRQERGVELRLRVGLNTGAVVVGRIGDDLRMDYTAIGDTTHLAARLQALAEPGTILITAATHRLVEGYIQSEALGPIPVKGRSEPVSVFRVTGRQRARSRLEITAARGLTRLVGRRRELDLLHDCVQRARAGRGQAVGILGEPGVGKSRLLYEFRESLQGEPVSWLEAHCVPYAHATPYLPIVEMLGAHFHVEDGDNPLQIQEKLRQGLRRLDPALEGLLPLLGELFNLPIEDEALRHLDPQLKRRRTFEAIRALTVAESRRAPVVVVVEDLHWIDKTSEDYLTFLVESLAGLPHLLLTTHRPGYTVRWADKTYYTHLPLDLLREAEADALVSALLGSRDLPPDLLRVIWGKAEGNPLFVEEITTSLAERGLLVHRNGGVRWAGDAVVEVPATVQDIVRARIDRLEDPVKRTVQTAAVVGREFGLRLLTRISETAAEVEQYLDALQRLELIHETRFFPEPTFIFKHAVIQDVAYQSLLTQRRQELHGAVGRAIEELYADQLSEQAAILAYHYARSERQDKAVEYALLAGDRAARLHAHTEARIFYEQALGIAQALPDSPETHRWQIDATLKLAAVGVTRQDIERDLGNVERARALADALNDEARLARALYWLGRLHYVLGDSETAIAYARRSLEMAERLGDDALAAPPVNLMGRIHGLRADLAKASELLERSVGQMHRLGNKIEEATAAGLAGWILGWMGVFERALAYASRGIQLAQEIQNPFAEAAAFLYRGLVQAQRGEWVEAIADYQRARSVADRAGDRFRAYLAEFTEGQAHTLAGDPSRGRVLLEESLAHAEQIGTRFFLAGLKGALAACLIALGELPRVLPLCEEAIRVARETGDRFFEALAHRTLADALLAVDPVQPENAERAVREAIRIQEEIGARPELARSYVSYARLLRGKGEEAGAREHLARAVAMFEEMDMTWDRDRAEPARP